MIMKIIPVVAMVLAGAMLAGCTASGNSAVSQTSAPSTGSQAVKPAETAANAGTASIADNGSTPGTKLGVQAVKIADILSNPKTYEGKTVIVQGRIASECPSGCWFTLKDGNAIIYIDLNPNNMVIPQKKGSNASVTAVVVREGSDVYLIGSKVDF
jgi:hypothetical protein